ncbi:LysR substrate-binding domain-containing protein [Devosia ginsengisoli]|uniref:LysR substrate-binding domain-containing protein n=1 Tax=Devosia ginsengisoli TaxID=400770 RepID=UPI0026EB4389|nr:LysR substrate-binding domain-containing protein [Devosia ginsengisoli]MCR6671870.1 LysR substrate-binding domain-containing protein [Devosia ginsengisoli]
MANKLTHRHIEVIRSVMLTGSATGAASSLHVTQPAVSHVLRDIDGLLQFPLFDRQQGRLVPTARANILFAEIQRAFVGLDRINDVCLQLRDEPEAIISVALLPVFAVAVLPRVIARYHEQIDHSYFRVAAASNEQVLGQVSSRQADIGFALTTTDVPGVSRVVLRRFDAYCLLPARHPLAGQTVVHVNELDGFDMISVPRADRLVDPAAAVFAQHGVQQRQVIKCPSAMAACAMVEEGLGFAILDPIAAHPFRRSGIWFARLEPAVSFEFCAYWTEGHAPGFNRERLVQFARERCAEIADALLPPAPDFLPA